MPFATRWPPAPLDEAELRAAVRPFGQSRMLPARAYLDPGVLAWELRHLVAGTWSCAGRLAELLPPGTTHRGILVGDIPVILTTTASPAASPAAPPPAPSPAPPPAPLGADGPFAPFYGANGPSAPDEPRVGAFANTCRHRGHELLPEGVASDRGAVVCPYHGWVYALDGGLRSAPRLRDVPGFEPAEHGLVPLPVAQWRGWVFVNATGDAAPFEEHLGAMAGLVAPYRPERLRLAARHEYEVAANWKVVVENYHECYHCPHIHPELCAVSPPASGDNYDLPGAWVGGSMDLREHAETMSLDGRSSGVFLPGADRRRVRYLSLLPDLLLSLHPDYVMTHRLRPLTPASTRVECSWLLPPDVPDAGYAVTFWDRTNRQDWAACESVQRGLASPHFRPGPFAPNEDAVHRWVALIGRAYRGIPPWAGCDRRPAAPATTRGRP